MSGKLVGAIIALTLGLILAIAYPSKQSAESAANPAQKHIAVEQTSREVTPPEKTKTKKSRKVPTKLPVKEEEEEEGC